MKFTKFAIVLAVVSMLYFNSQILFSQSTSLGVEGGINLSNMSITPDIPTSSGRTGFMVGGFADIGVSRSFSIRPGARFILKGISSTNNGVTLTDKLSYLEFPILMKVTFPLTEVKPYILAGPTLGVQLSASTEFNNGQQSQTFDISSAYETIDFGLFFGSGIDFRVANKTELFFSGGYSLGLTNVVKVQGFSGKNSGLQFIGGVKFGL